MTFIPFFKMFNGKKYQPMGVYSDNESMLYDLERWASKYNILLQVEKCELDKNKVMVWNREK